ncbi:MAG: hypothetical protein JW818_06145 [Pirellulales bacterium]|nr:hypothetical protein [Pirellulales bacterium]
MFTKRLGLTLILFATVVLATEPALALRERFGQSKEQLKLDYNVAVTDHGTGQVTVVLTITDEGRLKPLNSVDFFIPGKEGTGYVTLSLVLATKEVGGKRVARVHLTKELAKQAEFHLSTSTFDGKKTARGGYYFVIPIAKHLEKGNNP